MDEVQEKLKDIEKYFDEIDFQVDVITEHIDRMVTETEDKNIQTLLQALKTNLIAWHTNNVSDASAKYEECASWHPEDTYTAWDAGWDEGWESYSRD